MTEWFKVCEAGALQAEEIIRFDLGTRTFAVLRDAAGSVHATDGLCTHEAVHLADGFVFDDTIECPKHNAQFDIRTGEPMSPPACRRLRIHPVRTEDGAILIGLEP